MPLKKIIPNLDSQSYELVHSGKKTETNRQMVINSNQLSSSKYYDKAHSEMVNGKLDSAKEYYLQSLEEENLIQSAVPDLFSVYMRLQLFDDAINILNKYEKELNREVYLNLIIQVYQKTQTDDKKLIEIEKEMIERVNTPKKMHYLLELAKVYSRCNKYDEALEAIVKWEKYSQRVNSTSVKKIYGYRAKAIILYKLGRLQEADILARKILSVNREDKIADAIIKREIETIDEASWDDNWTLSKISSFITDKIDNLNLASEKILVQFIKDGVFTGTVKEAIRFIKNIRERRTSNDADYSANIMVCAKLVKQAMESYDVNNSNEINEQRYQNYLASALLAMGDDQFMTSTGLDQYDFARYCYLQVIRIFRDSEKIDIRKMESYKRFLQTFFYAQSENKPIRGKNDQHEYTENEAADYIAHETEIFTERRIVNDIHMFVIWLVILFADGEGEYLKTIVQKLDNTDLGMSVRNDIGEIFHYDNSSNQPLNDIFKKLVSQYQLQRVHFSTCIGELPDAIRDPSKLEDILGRLSNHEFCKYLTYQENECFVQLKENVLTNLIKYNEEYELQQKIEFIETAEHELDRIMMMIEKNATLLSYEMILPCLKEISEIVKSEIGSLYSESEPEIDIIVDDGCSINLESGTATIPLALYGKNNTLNAEIKEMAIVDGDGKIVNHDIYGGISIFGNGDHKSTLLKMKDIKDKDLIELHITLKYKFRTYEDGEKIYKDSMLEKKLSAEFNDKSQFVPIVNKFEGHTSGQPVRDKAMFFGREKEIEEIIASMYSDGKCNYGRSIALYGQTRTGKSSILYHLSNKLRKLDIEGNIILDIGSIGDIDFSKNINGLLYELLRSLQKEIKRKIPVDNRESYPGRVYVHEELMEMLDRDNISISNISKDAERIIDEPEKGQVIFNRAFGDFCEYVTSLNKAYTVILMLDEFTYLYDYIRQGIVKETIMNFWKALLQNHNIFAFVIGQDHMMQFVKDPRFSNTFQSMELRKVTYLAAKDAEDLMSVPIMNVLPDGTKESRYKEGALSRIYELTSGSAFLIMAFCSRLVKYMNEQKSIYITRAHIDDFVRKNLSTFEESKFFEPQYNDKSEVDNSKIIEFNKKILSTIAKKSQNKEWANIQELMKDARNKEAIEKLIERDVLVRNGAYLCKIKVGLYKEWLLKMYGM